MGGPRAPRRGPVRYAYSKTKRRPHSEMDVQNCPIDTRTLFTAATHAERRHRAFSQKSPVIILTAFRTSQHLLTLTETPHTNPHYPTSSPHHPHKHQHALSPNPRRSPIPTADVYAMFMLVLAYRC
jgi:hypothetical protein